MNGVDGGAETQKGEVRSCRLGILGVSLLLSPLLPFYDVGLIGSDLWIEDSVNERCIMLGTCDDGN